MITFSVPKDLLLYSHDMGTPSDFSVRGFPGGQGEDGSSMTFRIMADGTVEYWTPAEIAGAVWIDANAVTLNGSTVSAMTDKIAGTITATQGTVSSQPTLVPSVLNGEPVIQFDGSDWLSFGTALGRPANWTIFAVAMYASQPSGATFTCGAYAAGGSAFSWGMIGAGRTLNDGKLEYGYGNDSAWSYGRSSAAVISNSSWFLCCRRYTAGADRVVDRVNGMTSAVTKDSGTATSSTGAVYNFSIGRTGDYNAQYLPNGSRLKGFICVPSAISDADAQKLEGYYAHLCGLTSLLPSDHPYKTAAPTI